MITISNYFQQKFLFKDNAFIEDLLQESPILQDLNLLGLPPKPKDKYLKLSALNGNALSECKLKCTKAHNRTSLHAHIFARVSV